MMNTPRAKLVSVNPFAKDRHIPSKPFSHFDGTWDQLAALVEAHIGQAKPGYRDGVVLVPVPPGGFFAGTTSLGEGAKLQATYEPRSDGEEPCIQVVASGPKTPAKAVDIVLYRHDVLAEDGDASSDSEWEIISVNARVTPGEEPMDPMTMARNFLHLEGGTKGEFSAEDFARAIVFWSKHCRRG